MILGPLLCRLGVHRYHADRWAARWDGARRCVSGFERCQRRGCTAERFFERKTVLR